MMVDDMQRLERTERLMVRWMCSVSLKDRIPSKKLYSYLGVSRVTDVVRRGRLRWFGHLERKCVDGIQVDSVGLKNIGQNDKLECWAEEGIYWTE